MSTSLPLAMAGLRSSNSDHFERDLANDHPLALQLASLRESLIKYQTESYHASLNLQHYAYSSTVAQERIQFLESQVSLLTNELDVLRNTAPLLSTPIPSLPLPSSSTPTNSLNGANGTVESARSARLLSTLQTRTTDLTNALTSAHAAKLSSETAFSLAFESRAQLDALRERLSNAELAERQVREQCTSLEHVIEQYAALVRGKMGLAPLEPNNSKEDEEERMVNELRREVVMLEKKSAEMEGALKELEARRSAELRASGELGEELARMRVEMDRVYADDEARRLMVEGYMSFSQNTVSTLQDRIQILSKRHETTLHTLHSTIDSLSIQLANVRMENGALRKALDDSTLDLVRESQGRREEMNKVAKMVLREEKICEVARGIRDRLQMLLSSLPRTSTEVEVCKGLYDLVRSLAHSLDGNTEEMDESQSGGIGTIGRLVVAKNTIDVLSRELGVQVGRRVELEKALFARGFDSFDPSSSGFTASYSDPASQSHEVEREERASMTDDPDEKVDMVDEAISPILEYGGSFRERATSPSIPPPVSTPPSSNPPELAVSIAPLASTAEVSLSPSQLALVKDEEEEDLEASDLPIADALPPSKSIVGLTSPPTETTNLVEHIEQPALHSSAKEELSSPSLASFNESTLLAPASLAVHNSGLEGVSLDVLTPVAKVSVLPVFTPPVKSTLLDSTEEQVVGQVTDEDGALPGADIAADTLHLELSVKHSPLSQPNSISPPQSDLHLPRASNEGEMISEILSSPTPASVPHAVTPSADAIAIPADPAHEYDKVTLIEPLPTSPHASIPHPTIPTGFEEVSLRSPVTATTTVATSTRARYDALSTGFAAAQKALELLQSQIASSSSLSNSVLSLAIERLNDYIEDAVVQLEIEVVRIKGHQVRSSLNIPPNSDAGDDEDFNSESIERLKHKLDDVEHDVAILRRALVEEMSHQSGTVHTRAGGAAQSSPSRTFGSVMSSPLKRALPPSPDSLSKLGLRVPMPHAVIQGVMRSTTPIPSSPGRSGVNATLTSLAPSSMMMMSPSPMRGPGGATGTGLFGFARSRSVTPVQVHRTLGHRPSIPLFGHSNTSATTLNRPYSPSPSHPHHLASSTTASQQQRQPQQPRWEGEVETDVESDLESESEVESSDTETETETEI